MALFPLTQFDFPNCTAYDSDLREILRMYKLLVKEYGVLVDAINEDHADIEQIKKDFAKLEKLVNNFEKLINEAVEIAVSAALEPYMESIDIKLAAMNDQVSALHTEVNAFARTLDNIGYLIDIKFAEKIAPVLVNIAEINRRIDELEFELPTVYNIVKGCESDLVPLIYDVYDATRDHGYTAIQFDDAGKTTKELDDLEISALDWDVNGYSILYPTGYARNPFTGQMEELNAILEELAQAATGNACITASDYDAKELTAEEFEAYQITAQQYDFYSNNLLSA